MVTTRLSLEHIPVTLLCLLALVACSEPESTDDPDRPTGPFHGDQAPTIVLVSLDTTRADHVGCYGATHGATPFIDSLAVRGTRFAKAWATNPITLPSHATMLTGVWPSEHGVEDNGVFTLGPAAETLPEALTEQQFRTGAFVGTFILAGRRGLNQGFEVYDQPRPWEAGASTQSHRSADEVIDAAIAWLQTIEHDEPLFLWAHFYDPHRPYGPPKDLLAEYEDPYTAELAFCDQQLARLELALDARDRRNRLWLLTADHGESKMEHGELTHGAFVYEGAMRIPLIVVADGRPGGEVSSAPVSLPDLAATALDFLSLPDALPHGRGRSLLAPDDLGERALYLETFLGYHSYRWHWEQGLVFDDHKLVVGRNTFLHSLVDDPAELVDVSEREPDRRADMQQRFESFLEEHPALGWHETAVATDQELMSSLGYVVGGTGERGSAEDLPDARDRIGDLKLHDQVREHIQNGSILLGLNAITPDQSPLAQGLDLDERQREGKRQLGKARAALDKLHAGNPADPLYNSAMGQVEVMLGRFASAVEFCEQALLNNPGDSMSRYYLAIAYSRTGREDWAVIEMHKALSFQPKFIIGYRWIIGFHLNHEDWGLAGWWVEHLGEVVGSLDLIRNLSPMVNAAEEGMARSGVGVTEPELFPLEEPLPEGRREGA